VSDQPTYRRVFRSPTDEPARSELDEEMRFHVARIEEELVAQGRTPEEASREALARFGNPSSVKKAVRGQGAGRGVTGMKRIG